MLTPVAASAWPISNARSPERNIHYRVEFGVYPSVGNVEQIYDPVDKPISGAPAISLKSNEQTPN
jgi:hypothetical protein